MFSSGRFLRYLVAGAAGIGLLAWVSSSQASPSGGSGRVAQTATNPAGTVASVATSARTEPVRISPSRTVLLQTATFTLESERPANVKAGRGLLRVAIELVNGVARGKCITVSQSGQDVTGAPIAGAYVNGTCTDDAGIASLDLAPGTYAVALDLPGYNWGNLTNQRGQAGIPVREGEATSLHVRMGRLRATAATPGGAISGKCFEVQLSRKDVSGRPVTGTYVNTSCTDSSGTVAFDLVPGNYATLADFVGRGWGDLTNAQGIGETSVRAGQESAVDVRLGRIEVLGPAGQCVEVQGQGADTAGRPITGKYITGGCLDSAGRWTADLTAGTYLVAGRSSRYSVSVTAMVVARVSL